MTWDEFFADLELRKTRGIEVLPYPHPSLRHPAVPVKTFGPELQKVVRLMFDIMYDRKGVGLAAPQIGLPLQLFVVNHTVKMKDNEPGVDYEPKKEMVFVNPKIEVKQKGNRPVKIAHDMEGCLSLPGLFREVARPNTVVFEAVDHENTPKKGEYNGLVARIIQHENDHLHGQLFVDLLTEQQKQGVPGWLEYLSTGFEFLQNCPTPHYKSIEEEKGLLAELEKLA